MRSYLSWPSQGESPSAAEATKKNIEVWDRDELDRTMIAYLSAGLVLQTRPGTTESAA